MQRERLGGLAAPLDSLLSAEQALAVESLRSIRDPAADGLFWQALISQQLGGTPTGPHAPYDMDLGDLAVEVKFSTEIGMTFRTGQRPVFRWVEIRPAADLTVLVGLDAGRMVHAWVLPRMALRGTRSVTTIVPSARRRGNGRPSPLAGYCAPVSDLLSAVLRTAREQEDQLVMAVPFDPLIDPLAGSDGS